MLRVMVSWGAYVFYLLFITNGRSHDCSHRGFEDVWKIGLCEGLGGEFVCALEVVVDEAVPCISGDGDGDAIEVA